MNFDKKPILPGFENGLYERRPAYDKAELDAHGHRRDPDPVRRGNHVNVRLSSDDLAQLQKLALQDGVPLPSLIAGIVRKYLEGELMDRPVGDSVTRQENSTTTGKS